VGKSGRSLRVSTRRATYSTTKSSPVSTISSVGSGSTDSPLGADVVAAVEPLTPASYLWRVGVVDPEEGAKGPA
jgi:hypothetical protein